MAQKEESARARILASLTRDADRTLARDRSRAWTAGEILGAAAVLRPMFLEGEGPLGIAFTQPGWKVKVLSASPSHSRAGSWLRCLPPGEHTDVRC
jgi:hypothetical protein